MDRFATYDAAVTWLRSVDGHVGPVVRADGLYSVAVIGPHGQTHAGTFDTGYREAVRVACCALHEAMGRGVGDRVSDERRLR